MNTKSVVQSLKELGVYNASKFKRTSDFLNSHEVSMSVDDGEHVYSINGKILAIRNKPFANDRQVFITVYIKLNFLTK